MIYFLNLSQQKERIGTMKKLYIALIVLLTGLCTLAQLGKPVPVEASVIESVFMYVPNRVFDFMDIFRVRVRVGPGMSAGLRATKFASVFEGSHSSFYIGLPGPRGKKEFPFPVGYDQRSGSQVGRSDTSETITYYDPLELGFEVQPLIVGVNVGIGFYEILDFCTGLVFVDLVGDDYGRDSKEDKSGADEPEAVEEVKKEEPAPSEEDKVPAEEVEEVKKEEPAPSEEDKESAEEKKE
jgi:hypothetical protein